MSRLCLLLALVASLVYKAQAQQHYNQTEPYIKANAYWAWYDNNGLDFSSGVPVHDSTSLINPPWGSGSLDFAEGVASVSDPLSGTLLFYSDGSRAWNRYHQLMPNGDSLKGNWRVTSVQGTCIVPVVGEPSQYYIFSLGGNNSYLEDPRKAGLYYSIVDMELDSGRGNIVNGFKNVPLDTSRVFLESMIAIPGNQGNVWLMAHEFDTDWISNPSSAGKHYLAYEISESGVNSTPVVSAGTTGNFSSINHMSVSADRSAIYLSDVLASLGELMNVITHSELVRFDPDNGTVSNGIAITPPASHSYITGAFSPNSNHLYVTQTNRFSIVTSPEVTLVQLDVSSFDSSLVNSSALVIDTLPVDPTIDFPASLKSYKDSIYIFYANRNVLGRINQPDVRGTGCDLQTSVIQLPLPYRTDEISASPPLEVVFPMSVSRSVILDTAICEELTLKPVMVDSDIQYSWSTGDVDSAILIQAPGVYWVEYTGFSGNCVYQHTDTFIIRPGDLAIFPEITINVDTLSTTVPYATYQWMLDGNVINGATSSKYVVTENGEYQVIVFDEWGCVDTSNIYEVLNVSVKSLAESSGIFISPNPTSETVTIHTDESIQYSLYQFDGRVLIQNRQSNTVDMRGFSDGVYLLKVSNQHGDVLYSDRISKVSR